MLPDLYDSYTQSVPTPSYATISLVPPPHPPKYCSPTNILKREVGILIATCRVSKLFHISIFAWAICFVQNICIPVFIVCFTQFSTLSANHLKLLSQNNGVLPWGKQKSVIIDNKEFNIKKI